MIGWGSYGWSIVAGLAVIIALAVLQATQSRIFSWLRQKTAEKSDARIKMIDEMISSMKTVKLYCWETYFNRLIQVARAAEMSRIWNTQMLRGILTSCFTSGIKLIVFAAFLVFMNITNAEDFSGKRLP